MDLMKPTSCDTFVVMGDCTMDGHVIFGKNSDRPRNEVQEIIFEKAKSYSKDEKVKCTYIEINQAETTHSVILSKPSWMWGAEMGSNEYGVSIGNEAIWAKVEANEQECLLGMDFVRLGLERGKTAEEALKIITTLLETHGQGGPCSDTDTDMTYHNSYIIADHKQAWILETVDKMWAAEKITNGYRNISNCLTIGTKIDLMSDELEKKCKDLGLYDGKNPFNFSDAFEIKGVDGGRFDCGQRLLSKLSKNRKFTLSNMFDILRADTIGRGIEYSHPTTGSMVSVLGVNSSHYANCHWLTGTPDPKHSVFKPFFFTPNVRISPHIQSPKIPNDKDPAKMKPRFSSSVDRAHALYQQHHQSVKEGGSVISKYQQTLESLLLQKTELFLGNLNSVDQLKEVDELFKKSVESELKLYQE